MKRRIRLTESDLHRIINRSVKRVLKESQRQQEIFTISALDIENEEDVSDMQYCGKSYYDIDEAIEAATEFAKTLSDYDSVIIVTVYGGEYETQSGDVYGEPFDIYTISNSDQETTEIAREEAGYYRLDVDDYAV